MEERVDRTLKIAYLGNSVLDLGFKIAGITESYTATNTAETESRLKELLAREDIGIIIMTSATRKHVRDRKLSDAVAESIMPLIVEIPELNEELKEEDTLRMLILRAIGIDITKNV